MTAGAVLFDARACALGEGPLWHPERGQLFWFDILGRRLLTRTARGPAQWTFDEMVSAAGWIDRDSLLIASETRLFRFDLVSGAATTVCDLEADRPETRSNDGRADPRGGFWIGTMGKAAERGAGAIYRYYRGELRRLFAGLTIPNAICFSPDGRCAYFCDTPTRRIRRQALDASGWPKGDPSDLVTITGDGVFPDGAVVDAEGCLWNAQWGGARVVRYDASGREIARVAVPARQSSCPAFGGANLDELFVTSAATGLAGPAEGQTFRLSVAPVAGQAEHRVMV
ncbi:SMP-30/gluconolactonase/LRE family protein [Sedimentitalea sp. JM2-8]|uniref:SMP-30/gluconolactonase/LRE family protein n=1 Tax=Sedimentitalea xiamensis TaxID=3050037 RepID=A0ABT7FEW4_9RHOB|nr:SMP-30/gluconolactonase/LRE family protein [Sedimentitalea xiamensis]MDK3073520.1 SMP-30/gluconolactonase/LRE family protein [Sedimentitalea xiamensis]